MSLADALEAAASANPDLADEIRPANGDAYQLLDALDDQAAARLLVWLLNEEADAAGEIAETWMEEDEGVRVLLSVAEDTLPKAGRKVLRRVLHRLRSRGVALPEAAPAKTVARVGAVEDGIEGAWISPLDPMGARFVHRVEPNPQGGARLFEIVIDDARGIVGFEVFSASRSKVRAYLRDIAKRETFPAIEVDADLAAAVVARAAAVHPADRPFPKGFRDWRTRVADAALDARLPGDEAADALGPGDATASQAVALVEEGRIGPWPPEREVLMDLVERLRAAGDSAVIVSPATRREQLDALVVDAIDEVFDEARRALTARRLREAAWSFWKRADEATARICLAAAESFGGNESLSENPLARILLELPLRPALEASAAAPAAAGDADAEAPNDEESLIVTP